MYSPLWKITQQNPSVLCTPPFEKSPIKAHRFCVLPPLKNRPSKAHWFCVLPPLKSHCFWWAFILANTVSPADWRLVKKNRKWTVKTIDKCFHTIFGRHKVFSSHIASIGYWTHSKLNSKFYGHSFRREPWTAKNADWGVKNAAISHRVRTQGMLP